MGSTGRGSEIQYLRTYSTSSAEQLADRVGFVQPSELVELSGRLVRSSERSSERASEQFVPGAVASSGLSGLGRSDLLAAVPDGILQRAGGLLQWGRAAGLC